MLKVIVLILTSLFLRPSSEIVVEASDYLDQLGPTLWEFLNGHGILDALGQPLIKLRHFSSFVPDYPGTILRESSQIFWY
jgi:hypothetical protein